MGDRPKRLVTYVDPPLEERLAEAMEREGFKARSEFLRTALKEKVDRVLRVMPAFLPLLPSDASVYIALALLLTALAAYYAVRLVRAESPEEQARAQTVIAGCVLGGAIMVLAKPLANWVFGIDFDNPPATLPAELVQMVGRLLTLLQYIGGVVVIGGLIYGGIQLARRK